LTAYLEWKEEWRDATEWESVGDPTDDRPCQHPPPITAEDRFALEFFRWNCRNSFIKDYGMMPSLVGAIGMRRASMEVFMMKIDMIRETEARIAEKDKSRKGGDNG
jgi:hypothetical protein